MTHPIKVLRKTRPPGARSRLDRRRGRSGQGEKEVSEKEDFKDIMAEEVTSGRRQPEKAATRLVNA